MAQYDVVIYNFDISLNLSSESIALGIIKPIFPWMSSIVEEKNYIIIVYLCIIDLYEQWHNFLTMKSAV